MEWKVGLSAQNQVNYKAVYNLAAQMGGDVLPIKFKFGEDEDGNV